MKKILLLCLLTIAFIVGGCSSSEPKSTLTLDSFVKAFTDAGEKVEMDDKPAFQIIDAKDAVMFAIGTSPVKIYRYDSVKDLQAAQKKYSELKDLPVNSNFIISTNNQKAKEIFKNVK